MVNPADGKAEQVSDCNTEAHCAIARLRIGFQGLVFSMASQCMAVVNRSLKDM